MTTPMTPRLAESSRFVVYPESSRGVDPGSPVGYVGQHRGEATYTAQQALTQNQVFKGSMLSDDPSYDPLNATGALPQWLDLLTSPILFKSLTGQYTRIPLAVGSLHRIWVPQGVATPTSLQVQYEFLQTTAAYMRLRNGWVKDLVLSLPTKGGVPIDCNMVGSGDTVFADLAGTKTDNPFTSMTAFNSTVRIAGYVIQGLESLKWSLNTKAVVDPVPTNKGIGIPRTGNINVMTNLGLRWASAGGGLEQDFTLLNLALNQTNFAIDLLWADLPVLIAGGWCRIIQPKNLASAEPTGSGGGNTGKIVKATIHRVNRGAKVAAEAWGTTLGPYVIVTGTNDAFPVAPDGGATITTTLTPGTLTTDQIVTQLNAAGPFAAAFVADNFNGRVRATSLQTGGVGSLSSVKFDTAVAHHCGAALGFTNTVIPGVDTDLLIEFYNSQNTNY